MSSARRPSPPPQQSAGRRRLENLSRGPLQALNRVPKLLIVILMAAFLLAGLFIEGIAGAIALLVLGLFLLWLVVLSWPILAPSARFLRVIVILLVFCAAWLKLTGRG